VKYISTHTINKHDALFTIIFTIYNKHDSLFTIIFTIYNKHDALFTIIFTLYNKHDALFIFIVLPYHTSTYFGPICSPSSGGRIYVANGTCYSSKSYVGGPGRHIRVVPKTSGEWYQKTNKT
jgi:hypothetical protein